MINKKLLLLCVGLILVTQMIFSQVPSYVPSNGLVGYWPFSGNANDQSGNSNNGIVNGATLTTDRFGNINSAYNFVKTNNNYIQMNNTVGNFGTSDFSISVWFLTTDNISSHIINKRFSQSWGNYWELTKFLFGINETNNDLNYNFIINNQPQTPNVWYNLIITRNGTSIKYYINGLLYQTITTTVINNISNTSNLVIGAVLTPLSGVLQSHDGKIDDIGIWNRELTQQEITNMYNGVTYSDTCNAVSGSLVNGLVSYYPFCGNANDQSGNGNNGTVNGASLTTDRFGNSNSAYSFDGLSNYIDLNEQLPNIFSISLWVMVDVFKSYSGVNHNNIGGTMIGTFNNNFGFSGFACETTGVPNTFGQHFAAFWNPNPNNISVTATTNLSLNQWKNLIITYDGTILKYYVNGVLEGNSNAIFTQNQMDLFVGARQFHLNGPDFFFDGKIDDVGVWNRALTPSEITSLYNQNQCITNITVTDTLIINVGQLSFENPILYANNITIYPNPASTDININFNNITNLNGGSIKIINSLGQQVATTPITTSGTNSIMSLNTWGGNGLYFVQILNSQGQIVDIKKIILQ
ncbi:LamG-like jellyroll fold domain-containing protein [Flavobacterium sp.]|jgi:hypothetical protein|uniref:LamG-like jellyroll fold domain-containing protein n=1 Tax=Flavobacterium sp. TaxID=239 RepID=UPI0037C07457